MSRKPMILAGVLMMTGWATAFAVPAHAGGPTSVLAVDLETRKAAGLYYTDVAYERLVTALDAYGGTPEAATPPTAVTGGIEPDVRLTWLIHDQQVWRLDRIYVVGDDVWVQSVTEHDEVIGDPYAEVGIWHRPADADALRAELRLLDVAGGETTAAITPAPSVAESSASTGSVAVVATGAGAAGLLLGAGGGLWWWRRTRTDRIVLEG